MEKMELTIPKGCRKIIIEQDGDRIIATFAPSICFDEIVCEYTGRIEVLPGIGGLSVMWNDGDREGAIIANVRRKEHGKFEANNGLIYDNAVMFRDYVQYNQIKGLLDDTL